MLKLLGNWTKEEKNSLLEIINKMETEYIITNLHSTRAKHLKLLDVINLCESELAKRGVSSNVEPII